MNNNEQSQQTAIHVFSSFASFWHSLVLNGHSLIHYFTRWLLWTDYSNTVYLSIDTKDFGNVIFRHIVCQTTDDYSSWCSKTTTSRWRDKRIKLEITLKAM